MAVQRYNKQKTTFWRVNQNIRATQLRVIDSEGKQLGLFSGDEARKMAEEQGLDLVEIAPNAKPPVAKIIDYAKFRYQQEKKEKEARKKEKKGSEQKEVWFTPFIGDADYEVRLGRIKEFLGDGQKVRVVVKFKGNQMGHREFGYQIANKLVEDVKALGGVDQDPKMIGRQLIMMLTPVKSAPKNEETEEPNDTGSSVPNF